MQSPEKILTPRSQSSGEKNSSKSTSGSNFQTTDFPNEPASIIHHHFECNVSRYKRNRSASESVCVCKWLKWSSLAFQRLVPIFLSGMYKVIVWYTESCGSCYKNTECHDGDSFTQLITHAWCHGDLGVRFNPCTSFVLHTWRSSVFPGWFLCFNPVYLFSSGYGPRFWIAFVFKFCCGT